MAFIYFIHPPRDDFAETMTEAEDEAWGRHWVRIQRLYLEGRIVLVGPTLGRINTGICVFEADDEAAALELMNGDPAIAEGSRRASCGRCGSRCSAAATRRSSRAPRRRRRGARAALRGPAAPRAGARTRRGTGP